MSGRVAVVLVTGPDADSLRRLADTVVAERLAACVNILPVVESIYRWEGEVQREAESLAILKSSEDRLGDLRRRVCELHPYEIPEFLALPVGSGLDEYLAWVEDATRPEPAS
ncbi:MAG: divalent-cation tolerance protein CutA [Gemmatimonadota bacterium]